MESSETPVQIGDMPTATPIKTEGGKRNSIKITAISAEDQSPREYYPVTTPNFKPKYELNSPRDRESAAAIITALNVEYSLDAALGPQYQEDAQGNIVLVNGSKLASIYIDAPDGGIPRYGQNGIKAGRGYSPDQTTKFNERLPKVNAVMPKPKIVRSPAA